LGLNDPPTCLVEFICTGGKILQRITTVLNTLCILYIADVAFRDFGDTFRNTRDAQGIAAKINFQE
jgi:hypothetical protein